jgi:hypothetical protein
MGFELSRTFATELQVAFCCSFVVQIRPDFSALHRDIVGMAEVRHFRLTQKNVVR